MTVSVQARQQAQKANPVAQRPAVGPVTLLVATRKGGFIPRSDRARAKWKADGPFLLGTIVYHIVLDPRGRQTLRMAARTGHLGPTVFRSTVRGQTWQAAAKPPAFPKSAQGEPRLAVRHVFWLAPGHELDEGAWYAGTCPPGLFRSEDGGNTWEGVESFNANPMRSQWLGACRTSRRAGPRCIRSTSIHATAITST